MLTVNLARDLTRWLIVIFKIFSWHISIHNLLASSSFKKRKLPTPHCSTRFLGSQTIQLALWSRLRYQTRLWFDSTWRHVQSTLVVHLIHRFQHRLLRHQLRQQQAALTTLTPCLIEVFCPIPCMFIFLITLITRQLIKCPRSHNFRVIPKVLEIKINLLNNINNKSITTGRSEGNVVNSDSIVHHGPFRGCIPGAFLECKWFLVYALVFGHSVFCTIFHATKCVAGFAIVSPNWTTKS